MYQLLFVDDEAIVRDGISNCLPWGQNGFHLAGLFEHGLQALEYMQEHHVDVVISDINMPRMDGLALNRTIEHLYPDVMVLLLTGYDEFEYAREAVNTKVREFLLKPITADELSQVLSRVEGELNFMRERKKQYELMQDKLEASFPLLRERFLYRLVSDKPDAQNLLKRKEYFQLMDQGAFYQVSVISIPGEWDELGRITLAEFVKMGLESGEELFTNKNEDIVVILQGDYKEILKHRSRTLAERIYTYASRLGREQISAGCGEIVDSLSLLPGSYRGACNAVDYSRVLGLSQILSIEEVGDRKKIAPQRFSELTADLSDQLKSGGRNSSARALKNIFLYLEDHFLTPLEASFYFSRLLFIFLNFIQEMALFSESDDTSLYQPRNFGSLSQARVFFTRLLDLIEDRIETRRNDAVRFRIEKAKQVIAERMGDSGFSLQEICNEIYLSVSQFSLLFKEGTGQTFLEYLTHSRMKEAKRLLKTTDLKSYEVAEKTGYKDPGYFSIIFKKTTGLTPMEYRKRLEK